MMICKARTATFTSSLASSNATRGTGRHGLPLYAVPPLQQNHQLSGCTELE